jgi:cytochrome c biogenesis protein CcmG/thiol:disulfide interchange protein DsbE
MTEHDEAGAPRRRINWLLLLPPVLFLALAVAFYAGLNRENPDALPSALKGRQAPALALEPLSPEIPAPAPDALSAPGIKLVNFWASWCAPCRAEHPMLTEMAADGVPIIGVNYKDKGPDARAFLDELGNPYRSVGVDGSGRTGIEWGLYGVPETFVIDAEGKVLLRHAGPLTRRVYDQQFAPILGPLN